MKQSTSFNKAPDEGDASVETVGSRAIKVPALVGSEPQTAFDRIRERGLLPVVEAQEVDDESLIGTVCEQHPDAGSELPHGGVVLLLIAQLRMAEEPAAAADPEPVEEDGWFDIDLPTSEPGRPDAPSGEPESRDAQAEAAMPLGIESHPMGRVRTVSSSRLRRRAAVAGAITLAVLALLALRSCSEPHLTQRNHQTRAPGPSTPELGASSRRLSAGSLPRMVHHHQRARRRWGVPRESGAEAPPPTSPPQVSAPASPVPDACEFCLERPSP